MYEQYYGLSRRPFPPAPMLDCVVTHAGYAAARAALLRCLEDGTGIALLTAPAGIGKSLLCQDVARALSARFQVASLCSAKFPNRKSLLQAILFELGAEFQGLTDDEARFRVLERVRAAARESEGLVLIVDEVHLVSSELLEELRMIAEPSSGCQVPLRLMLAGQLEFEERLADRELDSLNQRIGCHAIMEPLSRDDSLQYVGERLRWAGRGLELFSPEALEFVITASDGNPRCIHQLCDHCLLSAYTGDELAVSLDTACNALEDLRALPLHWNDVGLAGMSEPSSEDWPDWLEAHEETGGHSGIESAEADPNAAACDQPAAVGVVEFGCDEVDLTEAALFGSVSPWCAPEAGAASSADEDAWPLAIGEESPLASSSARCELIPDDDVPALQVDSATEMVVDDLYARLDRNHELTWGAAIPQPPDLIQFLSQFAAPAVPESSEPADDDAPWIIGAAEECATTDSSPACGATEEALLETIRELQAQLRQAAVEAHDDEALTLDEPDLTLPVAYDVVEPEDEPREPAVTTTGSVSTPGEVNPPREADIAQSPSAGDMQRVDPAHRFGQLFTRMRQRRRIVQEQLRTGRDLF